MQVGMNESPASHATLPSIGGAAERRALLGGMAFLEVSGAEDLDLVSLSQWFEEHVVGPGCMPRLSVVLEPPAGSVALRPTGAGLARASADLPRLVGTARVRVLAALQAYVDTPSDDRFLRAAIFLSRVRRDEGRWVARPEPTAPLSGIVLSLFASAILSDRALYDHELCVCDTCGRIAFDDAPAMRRTCAAHAPRVSGFTRRNAAAPPRGAAVG
jgi:hypothetical protein